MENKKLKLLSVISAVLMLAGIIADVYAMENSTPEPIWIVFIVVQILTGIFAIYYVLAGCKKDGGANMFKLFMVCFAVFELLLLVFRMPCNSWDILFVGLSFGFLCVFSAAENLGKKKSYILAGVITVCNIISFIIGISVGGELVQTMNRIVTLLISLILFLMVACKYADKTSRGSK